MKAAVDFPFGQRKLARTLARLIDRAGLNAVILHEQPNGGRTIIEKFEAHGGAAGTLLSSWNA